MRDPGGLVSTWKLRWRGREEREFSIKQRAGKSRSCTCTWCLYLLGAIESIQELRVYAGGAWARVGSRVNVSKSGGCVVKQVVEGVVVGGGGGFR